MAMNIEATLQGHVTGPTGILQNISRFLHIHSTTYPSVAGIVKCNRFTTDAHIYAHEPAFVHTFQRLVHSNSLTLSGQDFQVINLHCD